MFELFQLIGFVLISWSAAFVFGMLAARYKIPEEQRKQPSRKAVIRRRLYDAGFFLTSTSLITIMWVISAALVDRMGFGPAGWNTLMSFVIAFPMSIIWMCVILCGFAVGRKRRLSRDWIVS